MLKTLELEIGYLAIPYVVRACDSKSLRDMLTVKIGTRSRTFIHSPHYWAQYYNDGINHEFGPRDKEWLVWFPIEPTVRDPRLVSIGGRFPVRYSEWRRLTKSEFADIVATNKALYGRFSTPQNALIEKTAGPIAPKRFFERGLLGASSSPEIADAIDRTMDGFFQMVSNAVSVSPDKARGVV